MTCRETSTIVAESTLSELPLVVRARLWLHMAACRYCRRFYGQVRAIDRGVRAALSQVGDEMPADLMDRVLKKMSGTG